MVLDQANMKPGNATIVAGIGCRKGVSAAEVRAAIEAAFAGDACAGRRPGLLAAPVAKQNEQGILGAAAALGLRLMWISQTALEAAGPRARANSARSMAAMNVGSVAEASALAAAGPNARLLVERLAVGPVICALAQSENCP
jgi:cobalt-precorrin 5A hydrolase